MRVAGATGTPAPDSYKTSATYRYGFRIITMWYFVGQDASAKARSFADTALARAARKLAALGIEAYSQTSVETVGDDSHFGTFGNAAGIREVALKLAARHFDPKALTVLLKEASGLALAAPPGLALFTGGRPSPSPVVRLFSFLVPKDEVPVSIEINGEASEYEEQVLPASSAKPASITEPAVPDVSDCMVTVPLYKIAFGRAGDKGNNANIGLIPRDMGFAPWIWSAVTTCAVAERFAHFLEGDVERFYMPSNAGSRLR